MKNIKLFIIFSLFCTFLFFITTQSASASLLDNLVEKVKDVFNLNEDKNVKSKEITLTSNISLAPGGDEKKNNEIDAGDTIRFNYALRNTTDNKYSFGTLKTNIDAGQVSFIHNIHGATGIANNGKNIEVSNVRIYPGETLVISFDALINYFQEDKLISTEPEFIDSDEKTIARSKRNEVVAKKLTAEEVNERGISIKK